MDIYQSIEGIEKVLNGNEEFPSLDGEAIPMQERLFINSEHIRQESQ